MNKVCSIRLYHFRKKYNGFEIYDLRFEMVSRKGES